MPLAFPLKQPAGSTWQSSPYLSSLVLSTLSVSYCSLFRGVGAVLSQISFFQSSLRHRFAPFFTFSQRAAISSDRHNVQTIAPLLIIERAANRRALTSETIVSGIDSIRFKSQAESASDDHKPRFSVEATMEFRHSNI